MAPAPAAPALVRELLDASPSAARRRPRSAASSLAERGWHSELRGWEHVDPRHETGAWSVHATTRSALRGPVPEALLEQSRTRNESEVIVD